MVETQALVSIILVLLGGEQLTSEAGATLGTRRFPYSKILQDLRSRESDDRPFSFTRETPPSASVLHTIRLRGAGDGSVLHDKVVHTIKGVAVRAKSTKLPDGSCSCLFTYDGGDALSLQVRCLTTAAIPADPRSSPSPPPSRAQWGLAAKSVDEWVHPTVLGYGSADPIYPPGPASPPPPRRPHRATPCRNTPLATCRCRRRRCCCRRRRRRRGFG